MKICPIDNRSLNAVLALDVAPDQKRHIETTKECLDEAAQDSRWCPVALYVDSAVVGFAMYGCFPNWIGEGKESQVWLDRLLIDERFQGKGYGEEALVLLLTRLEKEYDTNRIYLSVYEDNDRAILLYKKHGFHFTGERDTKGEKAMMRQVKPAILGMPALVEMPDILDCAKLCREQGLSFVELNMNLPEYQYGEIDADKIKQAMDTYGIYCTLHLDENFNACDFNPLVSETYVQTMLSSIELAKKLSMPVLNMHLHSGVHFKLPGKKVHLFEQYRTRYLASLRRLRDLCESAIGDADIHICVENCDGFMPHELEGIEMLLRSDCFGLTLDIGHSHCAGDADIAFFRQHSERLLHMHIHDANNETCHLPFGDGAIEIPYALQAARERHCRSVIEVKNVEGLKKSIEYISRYGNGTKRL